MIKLVLVLMIVSLKFCVSTKVVEVEGDGLYFSTKNHPECEDVELDPTKVFPNVDYVAFRKSCLPSFPSNIFEIFPDLKHLDMSTCGIRRITEMDLVNGSGLIDLDVSRNFIEGLPDNIFRFLANMDYLALRHNLVEVLTANTFLGLSQLRRLLLPFNRIHRVSKVVFEPLIELRSIDLSYNPIEVLPNDLFEGNPKLEDINFSGCEIRQIGDDTFMHLENLIEVRLSYNSFEELHLPGVKELFASASGIRDCNIHGPAQTVWLNQNSLHDFAILNASETKYLYLQDNFLNNLTFLKMSPYVNLRTLYLSQNPIAPEGLSPGTFADMHHLSELHVSETNLTELHLGVFDNLTSLLLLDLSSSELQTVEVEVFAPLMSLRVLDLSGNNLTEADVEDLKKLKCMIML